MRLNLFAVNTIGVNENASKDVDPLKRFDVEDGSSIENQGSHFVAGLKKRSQRGPPSKLKSTNQGLPTM